MRTHSLRATGLVVAILAGVTLGCSGSEGPTSTSTTSTGAGGGSGSTTAASGSGGAESTSGSTSASSASGMATSSGTGGSAWSSDCTASGQGQDFEVGPGAGQLASLDDVPWESLMAGATVRIFWQPEAYTSKFQISGRGTVDKPIRVCGVKGPNGERPIIDGKGATTRAALDYGGYEPIQGLGLVLVNKAGSDPYEYAPGYIVIEGLDIRGAKGENTFFGSGGVTDVRSYDPFSACIWVQRGEHVVIRDNELHDCGLGLFSLSKEDNDATVTKDLLIEGNTIQGNGVSGEFFEHNSYVQSLGVVYQYNHFGPLRSGAQGSNLKDRSVGAVIRYNFLEEGARSLDLVEAQDWSTVAEADPRYRETFVYGNVIRKDGSTGAAVHYGGDQYDEPHYRKGTLYFFNNTFTLNGNGAMFQLSTTDEHAEIFNNILHFTVADGNSGLRDGQDTNPGYTTGGTINLGVNWIDATWLPNDQYHPVPGPLTGTANLITGAVAPFDPVTFEPTKGSKVIDACQAVLAATSTNPVLAEYTSDLKGTSRVQTGSALDLGALEAK
jgi:hypothetical protein